MVWCQIEAQLGLMEPGGRLRMYLVLQKYTSEIPDYTTLILQGIEVVQYVFSRTKVNPARLVYALAGTLFFPWRPLPFGGPPSRPGYVRYTGCTARDLLEWIVAESFDTWRKLNSTDALQVIVANANELLRMQFRGEKDELDEWMMKGRKKSGRIDWFKAAHIPARLRHVDEEGVSGCPNGSAVVFVPASYRQRWNRNLYHQISRNVITSDSCTEWR